MSGLDCSRTAVGSGQAGVLGTFTRGSTDGRLFGASLGHSTALEEGSPGVRGAVPVGVATAPHEAARPASWFPSGPEQAVGTEAASVYSLI